MANSCDAIVIGAGPAGLAAAAALKARGLDAVILEKSDAVGAVWRRHYDRLHLHTDRVRSSLPGLPMPKAYGRYPSRAQVVEYFEAYAAKFALKPVFNAAVSAIRRDGRLWRAEAGQHSQSAPIVVVATGLADFPCSPTWPGMESFGGPIVHSSAYRNPAPSGRKRVLVVGYGNSGAEIALDLAEASIDVTLSVRSPVNVIPRDCSACRSLSCRSRSDVSRARGRHDQRALASFRGRLHREVGLEALPQRSAPDPSRRMDACRFIDVGTLDAIRDGRIKLRGDVASFARESVDFKHSPAERFDAVILATGFRPDLRPLLPDAKGVLSDNGSAACQRPRDSGARPFLLRRRPLRRRTISADRHRGDPHRRCRAGAVRRVMMSPRVQCFSRLTRT